MSQIRIRLAVEPDIAALTRLLQQLFAIETDFSPDPQKQESGIRQLLETEQARIFVAEDDGIVVALATLQMLISTAEGGATGLVEDVIVDQSHRGRGIGKSLLQHIQAWARDSSLTRLQLLADKTNTPALDFYRSNGWRETSLVAFRYTVDL